MRRRKVPRVNCSYRFPLATKEQVRELALHYECSQTLVLIQAIEELYKSVILEAPAHQKQEEREAQLV